MTATAREYATDRRRPRSWLRHPFPAAYWECEHVRVVDRDAELPLKDLLEELRGDAFADRMVGMRPGREEIGLRADALVQRITRRLATASDSKTAVETFLDQLFADLRPKHAFEHAEITMALLLALKDAGVDYLDEIARPLAEARAAEVSSVSQFARTLLR